MQELTKEQIDEARKLFWEFEYDLPKDDEIERLAKVVQYAPAARALTDEVCTRIDRFQDIAGWQAGDSRNKLIGDIREAVRYVLSRRTAEPQPAAPSPCSCSMLNVIGDKVPPCPVHSTAQSGDREWDVLDSMCDAYVCTSGDHRSKMANVLKVATAHMLAHPPAEWLDAVEKKLSSVSAWTMYDVEKRGF